MITKQGGKPYQSGASVKAELYVEANTFCNSKNLQLQPVQDNSVDMAPGRLANAELTFRCIRESEASRPNFVQQPNLIIENRNR